MKRSQSDAAIQPSLLPYECYNEYNYDEIKKAKDEYSILKHQMRSNLNLKSVFQTIFAVVVIVGCLQLVLDDDEVVLDTRSVSHPAKIKKIQEQAAKHFRPAAREAIKSRTAATIQFGLDIQTRLDNIRQKLQSESLNDLPEIVLCVGNEAGDLDTIVSALAVAFFETFNEVQKQHIAGERRKLYVPLAPFHRADFRLRRDAVLLFEQVGQSNLPTASSCAF